MEQKIFIENFKTFASIGVYEHEKKDKQEIIINLEIILKKNKNLILDKLNNVSDYGQFRKIILNVIDVKHYNLLETLCEEIVKKIIKIDSVKKVKIKITKPKAFKDCEVSVQFSNN